MARIPYPTPETDAYTQLAKLLRQRENELVVSKKEVDCLRKKLAVATSGVQMALDGTSDEEPAKLAARRMDELVELRAVVADLSERGACTSDGKKLALVYPGLDRTPVADAKRWAADNAELHEQRSWLAAVADCHDRGELLAAGANIEEVEKRWPGWRAWI